MTLVDLSHLDPRDAQVFFFHETGLRKVASFFAGILFKRLIDLHVEGSMNLPAEGACIVVANHISGFDVFPMQFSLQRPLFFMAKVELFENPLAGWAIRQLGAFPVHRRASDQWAIDHARKVLKEGLVLAMFPEGTRSRGLGLSVAKTGAARLAIEMNIPIVPLAIYGSQKYFSNFPHRTVIKIRIARPVYPCENDDPLSLTDRVMFTLSMNLPGILRGVYSDIPAGFFDTIESQ